MKRLLALGLAAVLSLAAIAATSGSAAAGYWYGGVWYGGGPGPWYGPSPGPWYGPAPYAYYPPPVYPYYYNPGPPAFVSQIFGSILGGFPRVAPAPRRFYAGSDPHIQWCMRYRTYNPATNLYFVKRGVAKPCVSPYRTPSVY